MYLLRSKNSDLLFCLGHSDEERSGGINGPPPSGELDQMVKRRLTDSKAKQKVNIWQKPVNERS